MSHVLGRLRDIIGDEATLALVEARGGRQVYVPVDPAEGAEIARIIGLDAARRLGQEYGREPITVPVAREWRIAVYSAQGVTVPEIARRVGAHIDTVRKCRRRQGLQQRQYDLFDQD